MAMSRPTLIEHFYQPFSQASHKRRSLSEDIHEQPLSKRKPPFGSPRQRKCSSDDQAVIPNGKNDIVYLLKDPKQQAIVAIRDPSKLRSTVRSPAPASTTIPTTSRDTVPARTPSDTSLQTLSIPSSQSASTSSQRRVKNGEVRIKDSDEDSNSNSDTSPEELDELLATYKASQRSHPASEPHVFQLQQLDDSLDNRSKRKTRGRPSPKKIDPSFSSALPSKPKTYKISLESLAKERRQYAASKEGIAQARLIVDRYDQRTVKAIDKGPSVQEKAVFEADLISAVVKDQDDEDSVGRLKTAIQRTEALQYGKSWSFFEENSEEHLPELGSFPEFRNDHKLKTLLEEISSRQQAFLGGYVGEYAKRQGLPNDIMLWLVDAACLEPREDLRHSYAATLDATKDAQIPLTPERIDSLLRRLGASPVALDTGKAIVTKIVTSQSTAFVPRPRLLSTLGLFRRISCNLSATSRKHLLLSLCRLSLDNSIADNYHAIHAIGKVFFGLIDSIPENSLEDEMAEIFVTVYKTVTDTTLRLQLLQSIPPLPPHLTLLRQRVALAFFFQDVRWLSKHRGGSLNLSVIAKHFQDSRLAISKTTDYANIAAMMGILSISIDCGNPPAALLGAQAEKAFNDDVDDLALKIKTLFTQINDTGVSHMKRTEAKEILEAFHSKLQFAIRTEPPPKKTMFGDSKVRSITEMFKPLDDSKHNDVQILTNGV